MDNAVKAIECKVLDIFDKLTGFRLNLQIQQYLMKFRQFQENNLDPHVNSSSINVEQEFQDLFQLYRLEVDIKQTDLYLTLKKRELRFSRDKKSGTAEDRASVQTKLQMYEKDHKQIPFDMILLKYIFLNNTNLDVRQKALQVLIRNFNQRDSLIKELARTDIIVSADDYRTYINFLSKQRQLRQLTNKLIQDEMYHMIYKKSPGSETKNTKTDIKNILNALAKDL